MNNVTPRPSQRPLAWTDAALDMIDHLSALDTPAYLVGGVVRDALLRRPQKDFDIVTPESGLKLARKLADRLQADYYPLDSEREVGRVLLDTPDEKLMIDVARFRGVDLLADLTDRDFTCNAMAVDVHGDPGWLIDPLNGEQDTIDRRLRRCNADSIARDPVRLLRAVRQSAQLSFRIEPGTLADMRLHVARLRETSAERVRDELFRLLALPKPTAALKVAERIGALPQIVLGFAVYQARERWDNTLLTIERLVDVLVVISPKRTDETAARFSLGMLVMALDRFRGQLQAHIQTTWADDRAHQALLVFALLLREAGLIEASDGIAADMPLSRQERERLKLVLRNAAAFDSLNAADVLALHRYWWALGAAGVDVVLLALATQLALGDLNRQDDWIAMVEKARRTLEAWYERHDEIVQPPVLVDGKALMEALDIKP
ncbi:MAG: hypothetical protein SF123_22670, partial [Chloroflexota bacterium]|nr:hypothetical protein [Chloroflexota bacterium]